ncbi:MAG TPA: pyridoxal phosphate-dependent aminotransferase [Bryobacteraceae bacterium]|nr:pyridoxal phosphate-dependent aminotransferase [Bryobacteraceae bacterium]
MKFSLRLQWDAAANPLSRMVDEKRRTGVRVLDLTESNPTRAGFEYPREIVEAFADERALRYDPSPRGLLSAREAVAEYYAARGRRVSPEQILLTASTSEAYSYLFKLLADPGDEILAPRPSYPLFEFLAGLEAVHVRQYPLRYDGAWHVDFGSLELSPRTRAIVVVNPNNPTGSFLKAEEWSRLAALGLPILCDEVFSDYAFPAETPAPVIAGGALMTGSASAGRDAGDFSRVLLPAFQAPAFFMSGLSKIAGLPQMKLGWIAACGPGSEAALERLELIADTYLSVATPVQVALPKLLGSAVVREQIRERTRANLSFLRKVSRASAVQALNVEGGWYAVLQAPRTRSEEEWSLHLLGERDVLVQPGFFFDFETEAFLVLSLLTPREIFEEGVRRILEAC